jgi:hypothetical protein
MSVTPAQERKAKSVGCIIHGHVYAYTTTECRPLHDSEQWSHAEYRLYVCSNCGYQREEFSGFVPRDEYKSEEE